MRWLLTGAIVVILGVMVGLSLPVLFEPSSAPVPVEPPRPVFRKAPLPPPEDPPAPPKVETSESGIPSPPRVSGISPSPEEIPASAAAAPWQPDSPLPGLDAGPLAAAVDAPATASGSTAGSPVEIQETPEPPKPPRAPPGPPRPKEKKAAPQGSVGRFAYTLHVESYSNPDAAQRRVDALRARGLEAFSGQADIPGKGIYHRVFVGRFPDKAQALGQQKKLQSEHGLSGSRIMAASELSR